MKGKEAGFLSPITALVVTLIMFIAILSYFIINLYVFQDFYLARVVNETIEESLKGVIYDYENDEWSFYDENDKLEINYNELLNIDLSESLNEEMELTMAEAIKNKIIYNIQNDFKNQGLLKMLAYEERYENQGRFIDRKGNQGIDNENSIDVKVRVMKIDYTVDPDNNDEILYSDERLDNQIIASSLKFKIRITIKCTFPPMHFFRRADEEFFRANGDKVKRIVINFNIVKTI